MHRQLAEAEINIQVKEVLIQSNHELWFIPPGRAWTQTWGTGHRCAGSSGAQGVRKATACTWLLGWGALSAGRRRVPTAQSSTSYQGGRDNAPPPPGAVAGPGRTQAALAGELRRPIACQRIRTDSVQESCVQEQGSPLSADTEQAPCPPSGDAHGAVPSAGGWALGSPLQQAGALPPLPATAPGPVPPPAVCH